MSTRAYSFTHFVVYLYLRAALTAVPFLLFHPQEKIRNYVCPNENARTHEPETSIVLIRIFESVIDAVKLLPSFDELLF
jgi:hypothetical protein